MGGQRWRGGAEAQATEECQETQEAGREASDAGSCQREEPGRSEISVVLCLICLREFIPMASPLIPCLAIFSPSALEHRK